MRTIYVLIDYENVQPVSLAGLDSEQFQVLLFVGASQAKLAFEIVEAMQRLGSRGQYIKIAIQASNALDFHIAYFIGHLSAKDPTAVFHIISKDTGFDPLIQHLKAKKLLVTRAKTVSDICHQKAAILQSLSDRIAVAVANLKQRGASKPRTVKTLASTLASLFQKQLTNEELAQLVAELQQLGYVNALDNKVVYTLPE